MLAGETPIRCPTSTRPPRPTSSGHPSSGSRSSPLTLLPVGAADLVMVVLGLACFALALWLVGVSDWRVYGVVAMWPQIAGEMRVSHLTPPLCLLVALAWRYARPRLAPGVRDRPCDRGSSSSSGRSASGSLRDAPSGGADRDAHRGRVPAPRAAVHVPRRLRPRAPPARAGIRPGLLHAVRPPRAERRLGARRPRRHPAAWAPSCSLQRGATGASRWRSPRPCRSRPSSGSTTSRWRPLPLAIARPRLSWVWFVPLGDVGPAGAGIGTRRSGGHRSRS